MLPDGVSGGTGVIEARRVRKAAVTALICAVAAAVICIASLFAAVRPPAPHVVYVFKAPPHSIDSCAAFPFDNGILVGPSLHCARSRLKGVDYKRRR
jgi:hypothetical protein